MENFIKILLVAVVQIYSFVFILRSLLYFSKMERFHPIARVCIQLTQPLVRPIQKYFPCLLGFETVSLFLALVFSWISETMSLLWFTPSVFSWQIMLLGGLLSVFVWLKHIFYVYVALIFVMIILRLFEPNAAAVFYIDRILAPFTRPFKKLRIGLFDFSILPLYLFTQCYISLIYPLIKSTIIALVFN